MPLPLQSDDRSAAVGRRAVKAFHSTGGTHKARPVFEHGHWWIVCGRCGAQWSVVDAVGPGAINGFGFEQVSDGDGYCG